MKTPSLNELADTMSLIPSCLMTVSPENKVLMVNHHFQQCLRGIADKIIGDNFKYSLETVLETWNSKSLSHLYGMDTWFSDNHAILESEKAKDDFANRFTGVCYNTIEKDHELAAIIINFGVGAPLKDEATVLDLEMAFTSMTDDTDILISIVDNFGNMEYRNPAWLRYMGEEMPDKGRFKWEDAIHADDIKSVQKALYDAISEQSAFSSEFRMMDQNGAFRWLKIKGTPRFNEQRRFLGYICTGIEISELKKRMAELVLINTALTKSHADLISSNEKLQSAFDAAEMGSCSLDIATLKAEMSREYRNHYGLPISGEINWEMVTDAVEPEYREEVNQVLARSAKYGTPVDTTYPIRHLISGERKWMRVVGKVRKDNDGFPRSIYAVVMDVSRQMEEENRKNEFISMISHELKTPLTSIGGFTQILVHKALKAETQDFTPICKKIQRQLEKMGRMIEGFLDVSRLELGKMVIKKSEFDFASLIEDCKQEFINEISTHKITFNEMESVTVNADKDRLEMVPHNLISNAIKYSPMGSEVNVSFGLIDGNVLLSVRDRGMGILEEEKDKLFNRYFRSRNQKNYTVAGFGIGLFICAEIIRLHQGEIMAEQIQGERGAKFTFKIPVC
ncbi:PAS domain-containing sensor histidine kinase [Pedobacter terrae]|uniref:PAS domain-containing sensor histidine kinase n=1 Tax=Pedobacter terrae TaxID=405671 RepID=UPI002FF4CA28